MSIRYKIMPLIYKLEDWKAQHNRQTIEPDQLAKILSKVKLKPNKLQRLVPFKKESKHV